MTICNNVIISDDQLQIYLFWVLYTSKAITIGCWVAYLSFSTTSGGEVFVHQL